MVPSTTGPPASTTGPPPPSTTQLPCEEEEYRANAVVMMSPVQQTQNLVAMLACNGSADITSIKFNVKYTSKLILIYVDGSRGKYNPDAAGNVLVDVTGKSLENLKIALKSDGSSEQAKIISIKTYTADVMKELCQSQETNADFVKKNVWIPYSFEGTIRAIFVKSYNVEDIISSVSAQVRKLDDGMFEIHFGSPQNGPISLKYKPDGAGSLFAKLFGVAVVQEHQLIISPSSLEGISDENLLILPGNYFKARFMSQVARPTSYEEVRMQVENVEKIWVYHNPGMELLAEFYVDEDGSVVIPLYSDFEPDQLKLIFKPRDAMAPIKVASFVVVVCAEEIEICEDPIDLDANSYNIFPESLDSTELAYQSLQNSFGMYIGPKGEDVALSYSIKNYEGMPVLMEFIFRSRNAKKAALKIFNDGQLVEEWIVQISVDDDEISIRFKYGIKFNKVVLVLYNKGPNKTVKVYGVKAVVCAELKEPCPHPMDGKDIEIYSSLTPEGPIPNPISGMGMPNLKYGPNGGQIKLIIYPGSAGKSENSAMYHFKMEVKRNRIQQILILLMDKDGTPVVPPHPLMLESFSADKTIYKNTFYGKEAHHVVVIIQPKPDRRPVITDIMLEYCNEFQPVCSSPEFKIGNPHIEVIKGIGNINKTTSNQFLLGGLGLKVDSGDSYKSTIKINAVDEPEILSLAFWCKNVDKMNVKIYRKGSTDNDEFDDLGIISPWYDGWDMCYMSFGDEGTRGDRVEMTIEPGNLGQKMWLKDLVISACYRPKKVCEDDMRVEELFIKSPGRSDFVQVPNPQQSPLDIQFSSPGQFVVKVQDAGAPPVEYYTVAVVVKGAKLVNMKLKDNNGDVAERKNFIFESNKFTRLVEKFDGAQANFLTLNFWAPPGTTITVRRIFVVACIKKGPGDCTRKTKTEKLKLETSNVTCVSVDKVTHSFCEGRCGISEDRPMLFANYNENNPEKLSFRSCKCCTGINPTKITVPMTCKDIYGNEKDVDYYIEEYKKCKCNQCTGVTSYQEGGGYP